MRGFNAEKQEKVRLSDVGMGVRLLLVKEKTIG